MPIAPMEYMNARAPVDPSINAQYLGAALAQAVANQNGLNVGVMGLDPQLAMQQANQALSFVQSQGDQLRQYQQQAIQQDSQQFQNAMRANQAWQAERDLQSSMAARATSMAAQQQQMNIAQAKWAMEKELMGLQAQVQQAQAKHALNFYNSNITDPSQVPLQQRMAVPGLDNYYMRQAQMELNQQKAQDTAANNTKKNEIAQQNADTAKQNANTNAANAKVNSIYKKALARNAEIQAQLASGRLTFEQAKLEQQKVQFELDMGIKQARLENEQAKLGLARDKNQAYVDNVNSQIEAREARTGIAQANLDEKVRSNMAKESDNANRTQAYMEDVNSKIDLRNSSIEANQAKSDIAQERLDLDQAKLAEQQRSNLAKEKNNSARLQAMIDRASKVNENKPDIVAPIYFTDADKKTFSSAPVQRDFGKLYAQLTASLVRHYQDFLKGKTNFDPRIVNGIINSFKDKWRVSMQRPDLLEQYIDEMRQGILKDLGATDNTAPKNPYGSAPISDEDRAEFARTLRGQ